MKTKLLLLTTIFVSFFGGIFVGSKYFKVTVTEGKTTPEWAYLDPYRLWSAKKLALKGDNDALMEVLRFYIYSMGDVRQAYFWARVGEKDGGSTVKTIIRDFNEKHKDTIKESVSLEQHYLDGGLAADVIEAHERDSLDPTGSWRKAKIWVPSDN